MRWVLVANASRARLFNQPKDNAELPGVLQLIESFEHGESRARGMDLTSDAPGRKPVGPSAGGSYGGRSVAHGLGRPGVEPTTDPKEVELIKFARELSARLERGLHDGQFTRLVISAPPHFLGVLKQQLDREVDKRVEVYLNKDLTQQELLTIEKQVQSELRPF